MSMLCEIEWGGYCRYEKNMPKKKKIFKQKNLKYVFEDLPPLSLFSL